MNFNLDIFTDIFKKDISKTSLSLSNFKNKDFIAVLYKDSKILAGYLMLLPFTEVPYLVGIDGKIHELQKVYGISPLEQTSIYQKKPPIYLNYVTFKYIGLDNQKIKYTLEELKQILSKNYSDLKYEYYIVNTHIYFNLIR